MENKKNSLSKNAMLNVIKTAMTTVFPVLTYMYVSRIFGTTGMGQLSFSKSITAYFQLFSMLGIVNYGTSVIATHKNNEYKICESSKSLLLINIISMSVAYVLFAITILYWTRVFEYRILLIIYGIQIFLQVVGVEWLYLGLEDYKYITIRTIIVQILSLFGMFVFVHKKTDLYVYAIIQVLSTGGANLFNFFHARKYLFKKNIKINISSLKTYLTPIFTIFFMTLFANLFTQLDTSMIGLIKGDNAVGLYSAGDKLSSMIAGLIGAISMVVLPRVAFYKGNKRQDEINIILSSVVNIIFLLSIPISVGMFIYAKYIILWFSGKAFFPAIVTTKILSVRVLLAPINALFTLYYFLPIGKEKRSLIVTGAAAVLNLLLNSILIPTISYNGAAIATVSAEIIEFIIIIRLLKNDGIKCSFLLRDIYQYFIGAVGVIVVCYAIKMMIGNMYIEVTLGIFVSSIIYFIILKKCGNEYVNMLLDKIKNRGDQR